MILVYLLTAEICRKQSITDSTAALHLYWQSNNVIRCADGDKGWIDYRKSANRVVVREVNQVSDATKLASFATYTKINEKITLSVLGSPRFHRLKSRSTAACSPFNGLKLSGVEPVHNLYPVQTISEIDVSLLSVQN